MIYIIDYNDYINVILETRDEIKFDKSVIKIRIYENNFYITDASKSPTNCNEFIHDTRIVLFCAPTNNVVYLKK